MNLFCKQDPILNLLNDFLDANIARIPDARLQPLGVIELLPDGKPKFRTTLGKILSNAVDIDINPDYIQTKRMANISGEKTNSTDTALGIDILKGFLIGFGCNIPSLKAHFKGVTKVSFSFDNVHNRWLDNGLLGDVLRDSKIDTKNPMTSGFFAPYNNKLLLIDMVIVSNDFTINVEDTDDDNFGFDVEALDKEIAKGNYSLHISAQSKRSLTFKGEDALPFAFTCLELKIDDTGKVRQLPPYTPKLKSAIFGVQTDTSFQKTKIASKLQLLDIAF